MRIGSSPNAWQKQSACHSLTIAKPSTSPRVSGCARVRDSRLVVGIAVPRSWRVSGRHSALVSASMAWKTALRCTTQSESRRKPSWMRVDRFAADAAHQLGLSGAADKCRPVWPSFTSSGAR